MGEYSLLTNGRFLHDLDGWVPSGAVYVASAGDDHYGVVELETGGDYITQSFSVPHIRRYQIHLAVKAVAGLLETTDAQVIITDGDGNSVLTTNLSGAQDTWTDNNISVGLGPGTTYTLKIINNTHDDGVLYVDDVWIYGTVILRSEIATRLAGKLGAVARERDLSVAMDGALTEGDYTYAIDAGLRSLGALNPQTGLPDIRYIQDAGLIDDLIDISLDDMLERLVLDYAVEPDITVGPRTERRSQIANRLAKVRGGDSGSGGGKNRVIQRKLGHD